MGAGNLHLCIYLIAMSSRSKGKGPFSLSVATKWGCRECEELKRFRDILKECTNDECGMKLVGGQIRKESEEVGVEVAEKRKAFEE